MKISAHRVKKKKKERKENAHRKWGRKNGYLIFLLSIGNKQKILKLIFNTINCLMKHNSLSCQFWGNLGLEKMGSGEIFRA